MTLPDERIYIIIEYSDAEIEIQWAKTYKDAKGMFDNLKETASKKSARATLVRMSYVDGTSSFETVDLPRLPKKGKANWRLGEGEIPDLPDGSK